MGLKKRLRLIILIVFLINTCCRVFGQKQPVDEVDPFIGTANQKSTKPNWKNGETFPGAIVPWGMVSVSPHNALASKSGYLHASPYMYGFGHAHLSGVGCSDLGNIVLMPTTGAIHITPDTYKSAYDNEQALAGYYSVQLKSGSINAEMTATTHTGISKYTFPAGTEKANVLIDACVTQNKLYMPAKGHVKIVSDNEVEGSTESGHFCGAPNQVQRVYFVAQFSKRAITAGTWAASGADTVKEQSGKNVGAYLSFNAGAGLTVYVKVGISYVSIQNARLNLQAEQPAFDFEQTHYKARALWNNTLSTIEVEGGSSSQRIMFYTGLYHMLLHPGVFSDVNGDYLAMGHRQTGKAKDYTRYHVYSLWDTYRNVHPFLTVFFPRRQQDMVKTLLSMYQENHWLPKWELAGEDAYVMVGDPAPIMLTETYMNGLRGFDLKLANEAMRHNVTDTVKNSIRRDLSIYLNHKYVPVSTRGSVSETLEYGISDYAVAKMAKLSGHDKDYNLFAERALYYRNLYDPVTGFLRPRNTDGTWLQPFNATEFKANGYIEGSAWNYLFTPAYDVAGLAKLMGGDGSYVKRLQQAFDSHQFVLYNEHDIAYPYLFTYFKGEEWRTAKTVREGMSGNFNTTAGGLPGNDDCGALSAWYVFSAMGFYPADPLSGNFALGSPIFNKITIHLDQQYYKGKTFTIRADNVSDSNIYIKTKKLNGHDYKLPYITHSTIENGGTLDLIMSAQH